MKGEKRGLKREADAVVEAAIFVMMMIQAIGRGPRAGSAGGVRGRALNAH